MKKLIAIVMLQVVSACLMADETDVIRRASQLLEQVKNRMPESWDASCYVDNYLIWRETPEFGQLKKAVSENWKEILGSVGEITPSEVHQVVLLASFCSLPLEDSFQCLDKVTDLCLNKAITKDMFNWIIDLYEVYTMPMYRLSLNYQNPTVADILRKAEMVNPEKAETYKDMLSGKSKEELEEEEDLNLSADRWEADMGQDTTPELGQLPVARTEETHTPLSVGSVEDVGLAIVAAARSQVGKTVKYDTGYVPLEYPMGDLPIETGACTDVIVRALRDALGMDLQELVHKDMRTAFLLYPNRRGIRFPDKSIDHRRVLNLMRYFKRKSFSIPVTDNLGDYLPGDIIANEAHIMIVSDRKNEQGIPLIIHNIGGGAREEYGVSLHTITGHYRMTHKGKQSRLNNNIVFAVVVFIATILGWRYFKKKGK